MELRNDSTPNTAFIWREFNNPNTGEFSFRKIQRDTVFLWPSSEPFLEGHGYNFWGELEIIEWQIRQGEKSLKINDFAMTSNQRQGWNPWDGIDLKRFRGWYNKLSIFKAWNHVKKTWFQAILCRVIFWCCI